MDALVLWDDGDKNVVDFKELKCADKTKSVLDIGCRVKMKYKEKWYYGKIIATEEHGSVLEESTETISSDNSWDDTDNLPLSKVKEFLLTNLENSKINDEFEGSQISIIPRREEHGSILDKSTDLKISKLNDESEGSKICIIPKSGERGTVLEILAGDFALDNNLPFSKSKEILGKTLEDPQIVKDPQVLYKKKLISFLI
ncbi:uncharacterized protein LOC126739891 isoform X2 [Anthonomus grandis grandis]|uniref:uncharacterized protein LOC126739891 isoform X2 n=1 Tax=Anthonomus grandis grandis TaxID=2921223 RepID=UPI0021654CBF|nr:uncharacterized protein LOC126739891 isoform X2 [Anthonomus grandis grandis]